MARTVSAWLLLIAICFAPGCSEEEQAQNKEFWLGIPDNSDPKLSAILETHPDDIPVIAQYKERAAAARTNQYSGMSTRKAKLMFTEKADQLDVENMRDLLASVNRVREVDTNFGPRPQFRPPQKQQDLSKPPWWYYDSPHRNSNAYVPLEYQNNRYGDMARMGNAMGDLGATMMAIDAKRTAERNQSEARQAILSYAMKMDQIKYQIARL